MADARLRIIVDALNLAQSQMTQIEKDLAGIEASGKKAASGLDQVEASAQKSGGAMQAIGTAKGILTDVTGAVAGFAATWKVAMDFGKAGAELNLMEDKFNRLATSIGSSGDALTAQLNAAMGGTVSNAKMVESAVTLMNLGLAKSEGQVVRMSAVSQKLNWDMQILGLTIANESTMRLDALGLSIEDVTTRQKALVAQGMSTSAAFREAVISAGEAKAQLLGLGAGAQNPTQSFMRLEAATTNLADSLKQKLAPGLANAAEAGALLLTWNDKLTDAQRTHSEQIAVTSQSYDDYIVEMVRARMASEGLAATTDDARLRMAAWGDDIQAIAKDIGAKSAAEWESTRSTNALKIAEDAKAKSVRDAMAAMSGYVDEVNQALPAEKTLAEFTAAATKAIEARRSMMTGITADAIALTEAEQRRGEVEKELADLNAEIAKNGPVRKAIDKGKTLDANELALAQAKLRVETEKLQNIERGKNETDAEFNLRVLGARAGIADLTAKMGEHTVVVGGATEQQLKQRDALQATLDQMQRAAEIDAAKSAFAALGEALTKGVLSEEEYRAAMLRMNDATGLFSSKALAMATNSALMNDAIRKSKVGDDVINALLRYGDALGSAAQRSLSFAGAPVQGANRRAGGEVIEQAQGGDWLVTRPTLFMAGEAGPERATFQPMSPSASTVNPNYQNSYGGDTIIVNDTRTWALIQAEKRQARTLEARNG